MAPVEPTEADLRARFDHLADLFESETRHVSSPTLMAQHPAYRKIVSMGQPAVPLMLGRMAGGRVGHWFWALSEITGEQPVPSEHAGMMMEMTDDWIEWGRAKGLV